MEGLHFWVGVGGLMLAIVMVDHARAEFDVTTRWKLLAGAGCGLIAFGSWLVEQL